MQRQLVELLDGGEASRPAICAPGRRPLDYRGLRDHVEALGESLARGGIGPDSRVALVLGNGPEAASAFLAVAAHAAAAPLNPAYREPELDFYVSDLEPQLLVVDPSVGDAARAVAQRRAIPVAELEARADAPAGVFRLRLPSSPGGRRAGPPGRGGQRDVALLLHTSGTTARPKMVPLLRSNLLASASSIASTLALTEADRCLGVMPLFHIHGLMAAVLASLAAGASVYCTRGFDALRFFSWLEDSRATWYTAVPTMHQAVLDRAPRNADILGANRLRFLRSSSASLPPAVMQRLEETFGAPVIESYGMTEAAHQMASNPLPPRPRKPGSVGPAAGPEVAIMDERGRLLARGAQGEVVIRGPSVTPGYLDNPQANEAAFVDGWFRTGDQGRLDEDGYLWLTGRLKEIINRGGEKISPREVDELLLEHPAVAQVVTFAVPHPRLGEDVAAAVVRRDGVFVTERELRAFARSRLAPFKVPRQILFLDEIPKGPTGKLQRIGLAEQLGLR